MEHQTLTPEERMVAERHQLRSRGILAGIVCNTIFGSSFLFSRIILSHTTPAVMLMLRFSIALLLMLFLIAFRVIKVDYRGKRVLPLLALGLTQPVAYFFCESYGIKYTNSSFSGVMIALIPIVAAILSSIFLREELKKSKLFWIFLSVLGVIAVSVSGASGGAIQVKGIFFLIGAVLMASIFTVISGSLTEEFTSIERTVVMMALGFVCFTAYGIIEQGSNLGNALLAAATTKEVILPILYLAVFSSGFAFFLQNFSISALSVQQATVFTNLSPIVSVIAGVLILHEPISLLHIVSIIVILVGIYMVNRED